MTENIYPSAKLNCAITDTSASFDPQLPLGKEAGTALAFEGKLLPPGICVTEDGKMVLSFLAPQAASVSAEVHRQRYELEKDIDGLWTAVVEGGTGGFCPVAFYVDGAEVLNPMAPIGFGASRPINYADIPQPDRDFFLYREEVPHGSVTQEYYPSKVAGCVRSCLVYTPPGYMKGGREEYPVLYLQHGHGENEQCWVHQGRANFILDNLIAQGKAVPCIVVMNNGMVQKVEDGLRVLDIEKLTDVLLQDCLPFIESRYRVRTSKWDRAMAGLSMGSMQTSVTTLSHPELFGYAGVFSGFVASHKGRYQNSPHLAELDNKEKFEQDFKVFFRACGDTDFVALDSFKRDGELFAEKGLAPGESKAHIEKIYIGEHEWNVWRECLRDFAQLIFK